MDELDNTQTAAPETPAVAPQPTKAELRAIQVKANREAKEAAKAARKADLALKRADGIIGTLKQALTTPAGTSKQEILATLTAKFPTRDPIGMSTTVGIQLSRLQKTAGKIISYKDAARGRVYGFDATLVIPEGQLSGPPVTVTDSTPETRNDEGDEKLHAILDAELQAEKSPEPVVPVEETPVAPQPKKGKGKK